MIGLMEYLPPVSQQQVPQTGADKYHGAIASGYDTKRVNDPKWQLEQAIIEHWLEELPEESIVLDCPVGSGRFIPAYQRKNFKFIAMDKSKDMLQVAASKVVQGAGGSFRFQQGNVLQTGLPDKFVDCSLMIRLTRWLSPDECQQAIRELQRVTKSRIIFTARVANHKHARSLELFEAALQPGWQITRNEVGSDMDYRILEARRDGDKLGTAA